MDCNSEIIQGNDTSLIVIDLSCAKPDLGAVFRSIGGDFGQRIAVGGFLLLGDLSNLSGQIPLQYSVIRKYKKYKSWKVRKMEKLKPFKNFQ